MVEYEEVTVLETISSVAITCRLDPTSTEDDNMTLQLKYYISDGESDVPFQFYWRLTSCPTHIVSYCVGKIIII